MHSVIIFVVIAILIFTVFVSNASYNALGSINTVYHNLLARAQVRLH
jgi:hypothetical protein